jgi:hypothetical protein|tara:strand:+ start:994 stop:1353 length:360 start_codon:yes stop_codon:yes gene_type:complete
MDFFINKKSTLPNLKLELVNDGRNDFRNFHDKIQNATINFTMTDVTNNSKKVCSDATIELKPSECVLDCDPEYYIVYNWVARDTKKSGRYMGQFTITFLDGSGTLITPTREELFINILD